MSSTGAEAKAFTKICRYFLLGNCKTTNCTFIHSKDSKHPISTRRQDVICRNVKQYGYCRYEEKCPFKHEVETKDCSEDTTVVRPRYSSTATQTVPIEPNATATAQTTTKTTAHPQPPTIIPSSSKNTKVLKASSLSFEPQNSDLLLTPIPPAYKTFLDRINTDSKDLWKKTKKDPESIVMFREMTLWGLDRENEDDYVIYFEKKRRLALYQSSLEHLVKNEMEIIGLDNLVVYYEMKKQMEGHVEEQNECCRIEMKKLGLNPSVPSDYTTYYGIKKDIAANVGDGDGYDEDCLDADGN
jgi:Zinc finger C-x8-C-x5-C-x3-H type (and similar)/RNA-binding, Nab2-type zinc finger